MVIWIRFILLYDQFRQINRYTGGKRHLKQITVYIGNDNGNGKGDNTRNQTADVYKRQEQLFGKKKSRGYDAILSKVTVIASILFICLSLAIVVLVDK